MDISKINFDTLKPEPYDKTAEISRIMACEGTVLLKNDGQVLPIMENETVSVFGRTQVDYIKSGTGSGGLVNVKYVTNIIDSLKKVVNVNTELEEIYRTWLKENPFDVGDGWSNIPITQKEIELSDELVKAAKEKSDKAIVVLGKTAGEGYDNKAEKGSYYINDEEYNMIKMVRKYFDKVSVLLNVGNIIDMKWVDELNIPSVMYIWQNGMEGGNAASEVVSGKAYPSGKLVDTIIKNKDGLENLYNFGSETENVYQEDIYVGYRFYETFCPEKVQFPFGFGLGYTAFNIKCTDCKIDSENITVDISVTNTGDCAGKETVQVYYAPPVGTLGRPSKELIRFKKTKELKPAESENISIIFPIADMKTYADSGEYKYSYILEQGEYTIYVGSSIRDTIIAGEYKQNTTAVVEKLCQALAPVKPFKRIKNNGNGEMIYEAAPTREYDIVDRITANRPKALEITGDRGIKIQNVRDGKNTLDEFVAQFSVEDLACISKGQGMNSPRVTPGTGGAYGGVSEQLNEWGIPPLCGTDGPSGIRMDCGALATSIPNGTCIASAWNPELTEELYTAVGVEMRAYKIETLLGPGINMHRVPLNGRNFEYFSEDPYLTGVMAAAAVKGIDNCGVSATLKHFVGNEQETERLNVNTVASERALREIYLKPFEIAVKNTNVRYIMTSYNPVNGRSASGNYDLNTTILRENWGYKGVVMTDWWAIVDDETGERSKDNIAAMVRAQNDIYMVTKEPSEYQDNIKERLESGWLTVGELQRNVKNILRAILLSPSLDMDISTVSKEKKLELISELENVTANEELKMKLIPAQYTVRIRYRIKDNDLSQHIIKLIFGEQAVSFTLNGTDGKEQVHEHDIFIIRATDIFTAEFSDIVDIISVEIIK